MRNGRRVRRGPGEWGGGGLGNLKEGTPGTAGRRGQWGRVKKTRGRAAGGDVRLGGEGETWGQRKGKRIQRNKD